MGAEMTGGWGMVTGVGPLHQRSWDEMEGELLAHR